MTPWGWGPRAGAIPTPLSVHPKQVLLLGSRPPNDAGGSGGAQTWSVFGGVGESCPALQFPGAQGPGAHPQNRA